MKSIFTRPKKEKEKFENTKNIIKNLSLYEQNRRRTNSTNIKKHPISGAAQPDGKQNINKKLLLHMHRHL